MKLQPPSQHQPSQSQLSRLLRAVAAASAAAPAAANSGTADDLKKIRGIGPEIEKRLNELGHRSFADVARWTPSDIERLNNSFGFKGRIERENWVEQAQILARGGETDFSRRFAASSASLAGKPGVAAAGAPAAPPRWPPVWSVPSPLLRHRQPQSRLRCHLSLRSLLRSSSRHRWSPLSPSRPRVAAAVAPATTEAAKPAKPATDDLKRIRGIGVVIEKKLQAMGVASYQQIAGWSAADIERVSEQLDFKGRIERENWIAQARILAGGGQTDFSRRVDRGEVDTSQDR